MRLECEAWSWNPRHVIGSMSIIVLLGVMAPAAASTLGFVQQFDDPNDSNGDYHYFPTGVDISADGKHVYLSSQIDDAITVFARDAGTGRLTQAGNVRQEVDGVDGLHSAQDVVVSPDGNHVYAIGLGKGSTTSAIYTSLAGFTRDPQTGLLTKADLRQAVGATNSNMTGNINVSFDSTYAKLAFSPDGYFLYVSAFNSNNVMVFQRAAANGVLTYVEALSGNVNGSASIDNITFARGITVSPDGKNVYVTGGSLHLGPGGGAITAFSRDAVSGKLTLLSSVVNNEGGVSGLGDPREVIVSPDGKYVYVAAWGDKDVVVFSRAANGELTFVEKVDYIDGTGAWNVLWGAESMVFSPNGRFLYVGTGIAKSVAVLRRDENTGRLTRVGYEGDGVNGLTLGEVVSVAIANDGRHLYVATDQRIDGITVFNTTADLSIIKQDNVDPVAPGAAFTYTLTVTNNGPADAQNVVVSDSLPAGMTLANAQVAVPGMTCTADVGTVTCPVGNLAIGAAANVSLQVNAPAVDGSVTNTASASADQIDDQLTNNSDSEATQVGDGTTQAGNGAAASTGSSGGGGWDLWIASLAILLYCRRRGGVRA